MKNRFEINIKILEHIKKVLEKHPDLRFTQILWTCDIEGNRDFYEEPDVTLQKLEDMFPII